MCYSDDMAQPAPKYPTDLAAETDVEREARLVWERARLDEAYDDIANGRVLSGEDALHWLESELADAEAALAREPE
jgi:predicted transcriptional regulator